MKFRTNCFYFLILALIALTCIPVLGLSSEQGVRILLLYRCGTYEFPGFVSAIGTFGEVVPMKINVASQYTKEYIEKTLIYLQLGNVIVGLTLRVV